VSYPFVESNVLKHCSGGNSGK